MDTAYSFDPPSHCSNRRARAKERKGNSNGSGGSNRSIGYLPSAMPATPPSPCPNAKPGLTTFTPGSVAVFLLPLSTDATFWGPSLNGERQRAAHDDGALAAQRSKWSRLVAQNATLFLTYLSSYEGMGAAAVSCVRGCTCHETVVDAQRAERSNALGDPFLSLWEAQRIDVLILGSLPSCTVRIEVLRGNRSSSSMRGGCKFKLSALTLRTYDHGLHNESNTACNP